jgi:hypothetical protein
MPHFYAISPYDPKRLRNTHLGSLLYTADGRFSVTISRRGRAGFAAGDLLGGTTEEKARVVEGYVAYAGRYSWRCCIAPGQSR